MIKVGDIRFAVFVTGATPYEDKDTAAILKATPRSDRLMALRAACSHIFRHLAQILLKYAGLTASDLYKLTKNLTAQSTHNHCAVLP